MRDGRTDKAPSVSPVDVYILFGSNLGDRRRTIEGGLRRLAESGVRWNAMSSFYETEPVELDEQPWFLNLVACGETAVDPHRLLSLCKAAEAAEGRTAGVRFGPRTLDVDILLYGDRIIDEPSLVIPHPRLCERAFALVPLVEIAPEGVHPRDGRRFADILARLDEGKKVLKSKTKGSLSQST